jgi:hypothetical protein
MTDKRRAEKTVRDIRRATRRHFIFFLLVGPNSSLAELIGESLDGVQMNFFNTRKWRHVSLSQEG